MDIYVLDSMFRNNVLIDRYESFIWTERYNTLGDFQIKLLSNTRHRRELVRGKFIAISGSDRVGRINTVEDVHDASGMRTLHVSGRLIEQIFQERFTWERSGTQWAPDARPHLIMTQAVRRYCVDAVNTIDDAYPGLEAPFVVQGSMPPPTEELSFEAPINSVYTLLHDLGVAYDLGFAIRRSSENALRFMPVVGTDRTTDIAGGTPVIFSPSYGNMMSSTYLSTDEMNRNIALVTSVQGYRIVNDVNTSVNIKGFNRRVIHVNASEITAAWPSFRAKKYMYLLGKKALAENKRIQLFDGEIDAHNDYKYNVDYAMGDLVELRNDASIQTGQVSYMRVVEQIFVSDEQGDHAYPTLEYRDSVTPGSWLSQSGNAAWINAGSATWADPSTLIEENS